MWTTTLPACNIVKPADNESLVIVLAGYEHIDDRGSLQDFFHLDEEAIWNLCLGGSFKQWVAGHSNPSSIFHMQMQRSMPWLMR